MIGVLNWALEHWFLIFLLFFFGVFEGVRDFILDTLERIAIIFGKHREPPAVGNGTERQWTIGAPEPAVRERPALSGKKPGPCVHRNVTAVVSPADEVVAWLCKTCNTKLPADWAIREEDL